MQETSRKRGGNPAPRRAGGCLAGLCLCLAGCANTPSFVEPPPAAYRTPAPAGFPGVWARVGTGRDERLRVAGQADGTMLLTAIRPDTPGEPLPAQAFRFAGADWLLLDWRRQLARDGSDATAPYTLVKYVLEDPDRLCGIAPAAEAFDAAIQAGHLAGRVTSLAPLRFVTVTSPGADWVRWWSALPESKRTFAAPVFCLQRVP